MKIHVEEKTAMAKKMLYKGYDLIEILELTELTKEEILRIQADMNLPEVV